MNGDVKDLEETASVGRGSPVQQELEDSETEASKYIIHIVSFGNLREGLKNAQNWVPFRLWNSGVHFC